MKKSDRDQLYQIGKALRDSLELDEKLQSKEAYRLYAATVNVVCAMANVLMEELDD